MKKLVLKTIEYQRLEYAFKSWLQTLGYSSQTIQNLPRHLREFLHWLESNEIDQIHQVNAKLIHLYFNQLSQRSNQRRGGGLSQSYVNKHRQALRRFSHYLQQSQKLILPVEVKPEVQDPKKIAVLSEQEIKNLYLAAEQHAVLKWRDIAMLEVFYSCGLRRTEGVELNAEDVDVNGRMLFVRKGKNNRQRYVPITAQSAKRLKYYQDHCRSDLLSNEEERSFLLSLQGRRIQGQSLLMRLKQLKAKASIKKEIGLHTLRHSIATHLLKRGMELDQIRHFLGHSSIESTQIYTHLMHEEL